MSPGNLEGKIDLESRTIKEELKHSISEYPQTWKNSFKQLAPAVIISSIGSAAGQWAAHHFGYDDNFSMTAAAYICGYVPGYTSVFASEYLRNREKYPGLFSKEFREFVGTFFAADYVADISVFTPSFITSNVWLANNTDMNPAIRSLTAWNGSGLLYISAMSALHPITKRVNDHINRGVKKVWEKVRKARSSSSY